MNFSTQNSFIHNLLYFRCIATVVHQYHLHSLERHICLSPYFYIPFEIKCLLKSCIFFQGLIIVQIWRTFTFTLLTASWHYIECWRLRILTVIIWCLFHSDQDSDCSDESVNTFLSNHKMPLGASTANSSPRVRTSLELDITPR